MTTHDELVGLVLKANIASRKRLDAANKAFDDAVLEAGLRFGHDTEEYKKAVSEANLAYDAAQTADDIAYQKEMTLVKASLTDAIWEEISPTPFIEE